MESRKGRTLEVVQRQARLSSGGNWVNCLHKRRTDGQTSGKSDDAAFVYTHELIIVLVERWGEATAATHIV